MAESVMGGLGGGMLGGLLGMGGGGDEESTTRTILTSRGNVNIVPDNRLNALIVQAPPADMEFIRTVLSEIDLEQSPETIQTIARPQLIPVVYQEAAQVAEIVKAVFGEKTGDAKDSGRGGGQPKPEDFIAALRGGRGGRGGGGDDTPKSEASKIIVAVDERSNSLVVTATPQDFDAVRDLVLTLDQQGMEAEQSVEVIPMGGSVKPEIMQQALETILGKKTSSTASSANSRSSSSNSSSSNSSGSSGATPGSSPEEIQRRIEFFRSRFGGGNTPGGRGDSGRGGGGRGGSTRGSSGGGRGR
jgi:nitrate reductase NapAB chaperone NapD